MEFEEIKNPKVYLVFTGLGKTYFCKRHPGWIDLDEEFFIRTKSFYNLFTAVKCYVQYGYNILTNASIEVLNQLRDVCDITIILPENTPEAKAFILNNVKNRGYGQKYSKWLENFYDMKYQMLLNYLKPEDKVVYLKAGDYLSDYLEIC